MNTELKVVLAIPMPQYELRDPDNDSFRQDLYSILDELASLSKLRFPIGSGVVTPQFSRITEMHDLPFSSDTLDSCEIVSFTAEIPLQLFDVALGAEESEDKRVLFASVFARNEFSKCVSDLILLANLARPGSLGLSANVVYQNGERCPFTIPEIDCYAAQCGMVLARKIKWPDLTPVPLETICDWFYHNIKTIDGFRATDLDRGLAAFSRIFEKKNVEEPMLLLWPLVGIEALYVNGKSELFSQVREKTAAFLGPQTEFKKTLSKMYDFRSRFVHGDLGFPSCSINHNTESNLASFDDDLQHATSVAIAVLAATLQEIVRRDWNGLAFTYTAHQP